MKLKKAAVSKHVTRKLGKRRKEVGYSGTWPEYWKNREQFHNLSMFPTSYSVPREEKMCQRRMIYWAIISFHMYSLNVDSREVDELYLQSSPDRLPPQGYTAFQLLIGAALLSFCTTSVIFTLPFSSPYSLLTDWGLFTTPSHENHCIYPLRVYPKPWLPFASSLFASCWFYPGLSAPQNIKSLILWHHLSSLSLSHTFLVS